MGPAGVHFTGDVAIIQRDAIFQDTETDNPSIPPPGKRTGRGVRSIFPFLVRSLATKPQVQPHPDDLTTIPQFSPSDEPKPRKRP